jgi:fructose/tagatose bisphosphate aldolase
VQTGVVAVHQIEMAKATSTRRRKKPTSRPIIVHTREHVSAALAAASDLGVALTLRSAPGAATYLGAAYFQAMVADARAEWPDVAVTAVLDCGDAPGVALGALRHGMTHIRFTGARKVRAKIADIAAALGGALDDDHRQALDLLDIANPEAACRAWIEARKDRI